MRLISRGRETSQKAHTAVYRKPAHSQTDFILGLLTAGPWAPNSEHKRCLERVCSVEST